MSSLPSVAVVASAVSGARLAVVVATVETMSDKSMVSGGGRMS